MPIIDDPKYVPMTSFGWLHLSDLHQGLDGQQWLWPNVREQFQEDLAKLHRHCGPWDVVFFTGDLTQRADSTDFARLNETLEELWEHLRDLGSDPVLLTVPGNHDLVRPNARAPAVKVLGTWGDYDDVRKEFWEDPGSEYRGVVDAAFANYMQWLQSHTLPRPQLYHAGLLPGDFAATIEKDGFRLGVVGLNSAFLQLTGANYMRKLALGPKQVHEACGRDVPEWVKQHDVCLLLTHHPPEWLDQAAHKTLMGEIAPPGRFAAHLFGHMHQGRTQTLSIGGSEAWRSWQAPSLFGLDAWGQGGDERQHGYTAGRVKFELDRAYVRLWPRIGIRRAAGFWRIVPDLTSFDLEEDQGTRPEPLAVRRRPKSLPDHILPAEPKAALTPSTTAAAGPVRVFMSYAAEDREHAARLRAHLVPLIRTGLIELWDDSQIVAGMEIAAEVALRLSESDIAINLISADYLAASTAYDEFNRVLKRSASGSLRIVPVIVRPCEWTATYFDSIQPLPRRGRPVTSWEDPDEAWVDVIRGLRGVIQSFVRRPSTHAGAAHATMPGRIVQIGDIFRTTGQPDITFVEPSQMRQLEIYLRTMGQGLVVEGPSGIGKTTITRKALQKAKWNRPETYLTSKDHKDVTRLDAVLASDFNGHLVVDDFHHLDSIRKRQLADLIKSLADKDRRDAKLTIIGINPVGDSLVADFPDLVGRFVTVSVATQPSEKLEELVRKGEAAANVEFLRRAEFIEAAAGSFFTLQQLCFQAAMAEGIAQTQPARTEIRLGPRDVLDSVLENLKFKYYKPLSTFAATDEQSPPRGAVLALLWLLSQERDGHISLHDAQMRFPELTAGFKWLQEGNLQRCFDSIAQLSKLFFYQQGACVLTAEDPQLKFYLAQMAWVDFARRTGHHDVRLDPRRGLVFAQRKDE